MKENAVIILPFIVVLLAAICLFAAVYIWPIVDNSMLQYRLYTGIEWNEDIIKYVAYFFSNL